MKQTIFPLMALLLLFSLNACSIQYNDKYFNKCLKWDELRKQHFNNKSFVPIQDLPKGFKDGCVFVKKNQNSLNIYVLRNKLIPRTVLHTARLHSQNGFPSFGDYDYDSFDKLNAEGKALKITKFEFNSLSQINSGKKEKAFITHDGSVCLKGICLKSKISDEAELKSILENSKISELKEI